MAFRFVVMPVFSVGVLRKCFFDNSISFIFRARFLTKYHVSQRLSSGLSSRTGFNDYETEVKKDIAVPKYFNFAKDVIDKWAAKEKDGERVDVPAFWFKWENGDELKWSFQELSEHSKRTANVLQNMCGLKRGDSVMVVLPKIPEWWLINLAAVRVGVILCPGTVQLTVKDLEYRLSSLQPTCIFTDEERVDNFEKVIHCCPSVKTKVFVSKSKSESRGRTGWLNFHELQAKAYPDHECLKTASDESLTIFFTSGTTGYPKMVEHSHGSFGFAHFLTGKYWLDLTPKDVMWNISDTGWAKTAYSNLYAPWIQGSCVFVHEMKRFDPTLTLKTLQDYPITTFCVAPTAYRLLVQEDIKSFNFPHLEHCVSAGEPLGAEVIKQWKDETGLLIYEGYGQTETVLLCALSRCIHYKAGSMGKPLPGIDLRIINDLGEGAEVGKVGKIALKLKPRKPIGLFKGYKSQKEKNFDPLDKDYHFTGDLGYRDEEGYFWFVSRSDDVILSSGYRIGPYEVESVIMSHPAVLEVAVVSSPDAQRGEVVKAFIVLKAEYEDYDKEKLKKEIQDHVKSITAPYKYPRKVEFIKELPKTVSGKIQRFELKAKEWAEHNAHNVIQ